VNKTEDDLKLIPI